MLCRRVRRRGHWLWQLPRREERFDDAFRHLTDPGEIPLQARPRPGLRLADNGRPPDVPWIGMGSVVLILGWKIFCQDP